MGSLDRSIRAVLRVALSFVIVTTILVAGSWMLERRNADQSVANDIASLQEAPRRISDGAHAFARRTEARASGLRNQTLQAVSARLARLEVEIAEKQDEQRSLAPGFEVLIAGPNVGKVVDWALLGIEVEILMKERGYLGMLQAYLQPANVLETLHSNHLAAYANLKANEWAQAELRAEHQLTASLPWTDAGRRMKALKEQETSLRDINRRAHDVYESQRQVFTLVAQPAAQFAIGKDAVNRMVAGYKVSIDQKVRSLQAAGDDVAGRYRTVASTAALVVAGLILTPVFIRAFLYFVLAPLAARRPRIRLIPTAIGVIVRGQGVEGGSTRSAVSLPVLVDAESELLVQPGLLQSSTLERSKRTQWLLNPSFPISSLLSGMVALTRVRSEQTETVVLSATDDPLCELAAIPLPPGAAIVLLPRCLVGVLTRRGLHMRITQHWRLFSLHAWLTLQLRYLVFHGPATLIVKGCRGVRCELASPGRRINQAATLGFSANLAYSTMRNETFVPYLRAREALFDDVFSGPGYYLYEETPRLSQAGGDVGRQLEAVIDASLKAFGV